MLFFLLPRALRPAALLAVASALPGLAAIAPAHAQVVFNNGSATRTEAYYSDVDRGQFACDAFHFTGLTTFDTVQWWGSYGPTNTPPATDSFTLSLHTMTNNNRPQVTPFVTFTLGNNVNRTPDGTSGTFSLFRYTATLSSPITLGAGTYGLGIINDTTGDLDDNWFWESSTVSGGTAQGEHFYRSNGAYRPVNDELAFNLQNSAAVAPVPEPSTWAGMGMASFALCGLMVRARRKARS